MRKRLGRLGLNRKISLAIFCLALIPLLLFSYLMFGQMRDSVVEDKVAGVTQNLLQLQARMEKTAELCNMTAQVFQNNVDLHAFLVRAKTGAPISPEELIVFYRNDVAALEKLVNANPYLYQVRVYYDNENVPEIMPLLYHTERMQKLSWAQERWISDNWQFDYDDRIFPEEVMKPAQHLMSLVCKMEDYEYGTVGVLEVVVRMDELMPGLYGETGGDLSGFVTDEDGRWHGKAAEMDFWVRYGAEVFFALDRGKEGVQYKSVEMDGERAIICAVPLSQLSGHYVQMVFPRETASELADKRNLFLAGTGLCILLLAAAVNLIVNAMLRRFFMVTETVSQVGGGDLTVRVPDLGEDEVGGLGRQINVMLGQISTLMEENLARERSAKDAEIKALQSQINAHFFYNVLESIKMMAEIKGFYQISDAITSLAKLLRYGMRQTNDLVCISEEVDYIRNYMELINLRFERQILLHVELSETALKAKIPKLTLQPVVENAILHGLSDKEEGAVIHVGERAAPCGLIIEITDNGKGMSVEEVAACKDKMGKGRKEGGGERGIGLQNVHERIAMAFGTGYGISLFSALGQFTRVEIAVPTVETKEEGK